MDMLDGLHRLRRCKSKRFLSVCNFAWEKILVTELHEQFAPVVDMRLAVAHGACRHTAWRIAYI